MPEIKNLFVKNGSLLTRVPIDTIHWIEANGRKVYIHTDSEVITSNSSIKHVDDTLKDAPLVRVHKSFMVNINKIIDVRNNQVHLINGSIQIGRTYTKHFKQLMKSLVI